MWILSGRRRRVLNSSIVVMLVIYVLQILVCGDCCLAGAIRIFPENGMRKMMERKVRNNMEDIQNNFYGTTTSFSFKGRTDKGFEESKRRVPSCPDPLHN
ncbi:hypothetical protein F3Y22_tig00003041pilonHSYRG01252 [Hibiscus syriacus]|uniref:Uncharacterized protein n=1 Tax=Hibiscus syriacus TaxID=106335 RepID=A0A6A3CSY8_HIBSY|nr:hypothetical protein F3Y22_tig00003041pilonHSYRG01252 [Hibiscus syriacus]